MLRIAEVFLRLLLLPPPPLPPACVGCAAAVLYVSQALAKELSAKGKAAAEAMWAAHDTASSRIYQQRNARLQQQVASSRGGGAAVIDLHGEVTLRWYACRPTVR